MQKKTIIVLFIISMVFNIAFVSTFAYHRFLIGPRILTQDFPPREPPPRFHRLLREHKEILLPKRHEFLEARRGFMQALTEEDFDNDKIRLRFENMLRAQMELEKMTGEQLIDIRSKLSAEDARMLFPEAQEERREMRKFLNKKREIRKGGM